MNIKQTISLSCVLCTLLSHGVIAQTVTLDQAVERAVQNDPVVYRR